MVGEENIDIFLPQLERLSREKRRLFHSCQEKCPIDAIDHAFNACVIAHHLTDFFFQHHSSIHCNNTFSDWRNKIVDSRIELKIVHDIANTSKHLKIKKPQSYIQSFNIGSVRTSITTSGLEQKPRKYLRVKCGESYIDEILMKVYNFWFYKHFSEKPLSL